MRGGAEEVAEDAALEAAVKAEDGIAAAEGTAWGDNNDEFELAEFGFVGTGEECEFESEFGMTGNSVSCVAEKKATV